MGLFNLVEQQDAVGCLADGVGEQAAVLVAHITRRRADELGDGMFLGIFTHVEAHELDAQFLSQHTGHLGLADARRTDEEQRGEGLVVVEQSGFRHLHRLHHLTDGFVLAVDLREQARGEGFQLAVVVVLLHRHCIHLAGLCQHVGNIRLRHISPL